MLKLLTPSNASAERRYVAEVVFRQFLGLDFEMFQHERNQVIVTDGSDKRLFLNDGFFCDLNERLLDSNKMPSLPLRKFTVGESGLAPILTDPELPVLFGHPLPTGKFIELDGDEIHLGVDILGSTFFMLSRYEELICSERDQYDRFPAIASVAFKGGFLDRPIVNEYVEVLWQCLKHLWNGLVRRQRRFRIFLSHDVDHPFLLRNTGFQLAVRTMAGDALKRASPIRALKRPAEWVASRFLGPHHDPGYTFNYIMDLSEAHHLRSAFYFIPSVSAGPPDYRYGIRDPDIQNLLGDIYRRGHEIGYHASIETYKDAQLIHSEIALLRSACEQIGPGPQINGGRQHFLRIQVPATVRFLAAAGLDYDTTLGYADCAGFRCGTCWEYPFYDLQERKVMSIVERPLIVMECSVIDQNYMGLGHGAEAANLILKLARTCRLFSGDFTLLWHNNRLIHHEERSLYEWVLPELGH